MKTLEQVEPRIPIDAAHTPGDAESMFRITAAGSYYLTGNLIGQSGKNGIFVAADNVTIDLNGYTMSGVAGSFRGIDAVPETSSRFARNITVRNGSVVKWPSSGVFLSEGARFERLTVSENGGNGIRGSDSSLAIDCQATGNTGTGIELGANSVIRSCAAKDNGNAGLGVGSGSTVTQSVAVSNSGIGIRIDTGSTAEGCSVNENGIGISGGDRTTVLDCTVTANESRGIALARTANVQRCNVSGNNGAAGIFVTTRSQIIDCIVDDNGPDIGEASGIDAGDRTIVKRCTATNNRLNGILVGGESIVTENRASNNGGAPGSVNGAGIRTKAGAAGSRIEGNQTRDNRGAGIDGEASDVIVRNTSGNNAPGQDYVPSSGPNVGPVSTTVTGATHPLANIQF